MRKIIKMVFILLLVATIVISSFFIFRALKEDEEQEKIYEEIKDIADNNKSTDDETTDIIDIKELYKINSDIIAWIRIDNSNIDYPVMQTKNNPNYYLRKNFYKEYSYWGTPYLSENCDINISDNLIIYGHNINNSKMFGELENYKEETYYKSHNIIKLYTLEEYREYEIISIFTTIVYTGFEYYNFINLHDEDEFNTFVNKCKELSFFDTGNTAIYGDKLLTLSTCDYSSQNARLVIIAKQII